MSRTGRHWKVGYKAERRGKWDRTARRVVSAGLLALTASNQEMLYAVQYRTAHLCKSQDVSAAIAEDRASRNMQ